MRLSLPLLLGLGLFGCVTPPDPRWRSIDRVMHPRVDAVVLLDEARLTFDLTPENGLRLERRTRIKVLTPGGRSHAEVAIPLDAWTTLEDFEAWSSDVQGTERMTADKTTVYTVPAWPDAGILYSDARVARTVVPGVDVGDVFEYRYTVRITQTFALPTWIFEGELPVAESRLMVRDKPDLKLRWSFADNGELRDFKPTRRNGWMIWERRDRPAFERIDFGPPIAEQLARLRLVLETSPAGGTWATLAGWYHELTEARLALPDAERKAIVALGTGKSEAERAKLVFERVRDRIRYVATHEGIGAFQSHAVAEVLRSGYGDCKDMVTTALAYARALKLTAHPVLIGTAGHGIFDKALPAVSSFNHVIIALMVDGRLRFADPTAKSTVWGELPWQVQGRIGLLVGTGQSKLLALKARPSETNRTQIQWQIGADASLKLTARMTGLMAQRWRGLTSPRAQTRAVRGRFFGAMRTATIAAVAIVAVDDAIEVTAEAVWPDLWRSFGDGQQGMALYPFVDRFSEVRVPAKHMTTVHLGSPHTSRIELVLPWTEGALPAGSHAKTPIGESVWTVEGANSTATLAHTFTMTHAKVPAESLPALRRLTDHGTQISRMVLMRPDPGPAAVDGPIPANGGAQ
ncbi:MAG: transglutaminase-like putative cysteine protease [Bradymonadia bacterium]|jgi:transglutaminase-like putative cysteine protease